MSETDIFNVRGSISAKIGFAFLKTTALATETNPYEGIITSSPFFKFNRIAEISKAAVQLCVKPIKLELITVALIENNELIAIREFQQGNLSSNYQSILDMAMVEWLYKDKYDGCYERLEYTLVKKFNKGNTHN